MGPTARESEPFIGADFGFGQLCVCGVTIHLQNAVVANRFEDS
jgi:hypothetical protein